MARASRRRAAPRTDDQRLLEAARSVVTRRFKPGWHSIGAALRGRSGRLYTAVNLNAKYVGRVDVCAEAVAVGMAVAAGEKGLDAIVAVRHPRPGSKRTRIRIVAPCGVCREMLNDYAPNATVLLPGPRGTVLRRRAKDLLPERYEDP